MDEPDVVVVGAGISGLAFAWRAAGAGRRVLVLEKSPRVGGCLYSHRSDGHWFELGAHTVYNSYGGMLDIAADTGVTDALVERGEARAKFGLLRDGVITWLTPPKVLLQLSWLEVALRAPVGILRSKEGKTAAEYYSGLIGPRNFARILSPFFAAVPSQSADGFPASGPGSLFKKRPRKEDYPRSFGFEGGLQAVCDGVAAMDGVSVETGASVERIEPGRVWLAGGRSVEAGLIAVASPADVASSVLGTAYPELASAIGRVGMVEVESMGVRLARAACALPECAFVVPVGDVFFSAVTRDAFPDEKWRSFAFHFRPGTPSERKRTRIAEVLGVEPGELGEVVENRPRLPSPRVDHADVVRAIDRALTDASLAVTGNYFGGLAIEDCVQRSFQEWERVSG